LSKVTFKKKEKKKNSFSSSFTYH